MPGYIKKKLQEYKHSLPRRIQNCPYPPEPKQFGVDAQAPIVPDATASLDAKGIKRIQQIMGSILYYARAVDMTVLMALACEHFFSGWMPKKEEPIKFNGAFYVNTTILRFVMASAAEAELDTLFHNCQEGIIFWQTLGDLGHPQPKMPVHCDNATAVGIANTTVKRQRSRAMEMRFFWIGDKVAQDMYQVAWHPI